MDNWFICGLVNFRGHDFYPVNLRKEYFMGIETNSYVEGIHQGLITVGVSTKSQGASYNYFILVYDLFVVAMHEPIRDRTKDLPVTRQILNQQSLNDTQFELSSVCCITLR